MKRRVSTYLLIIFSVLVLLYRVLPALSDAPVFSIDAWPLLADSNYLLQNGHATLFPFACYNQPSCYFSIWPSLGILTSQVSLVTSLPLEFTTVPVTLASAILFSASLLLLFSLITKRLWMLGAMLFAAAPLNLFYSGYKQEMLGMPIAILVIYIIASRLNSIDRKMAFTGLVLSIGATFTHHLSTYILVSTLLTFGVVALIRPGYNAGRGIAYFVVLNSAVALGYYLFQYQSIVRVSSYDLNFLLTLLSYQFVVTMVVFSSTGKVKKSLPWKSFLLAVVGSLTVPILATALYVSPSSSLIPQIIYLLMLVPLVGYGLSLIREKNNDISLLILSWLSAPIALVLFAVFEGDAVLVYRGYIAALIPSLFLASAYFSLSGRDLLKGGKITKLVAVGFVILTLGSFYFGLYAEALPVTGERDIYDGSTWYYPSEVITTLNYAFVLLQNATVYTDLPIASYALYDNVNSHIFVATLAQLKEGRENGVFLIQTKDTSAFYFAGGFASIPVNLSFIQHSSIYFSSEGIVACN